MGFFDFFRQPDINEGVREYRKASGAVLLDVRTPQEYAEGRIPGSKNVPLQDIGRGVAAAKNTPLYVYCYSGARSRQAVSVLRRMGYTGAVNIGGIAAYSGKVEK